ncbi:hypothetical protein PM082_013727 [Marasmius tenuissimus]|nr:hypothetical protein PM082_013727 [Marasmius tenuissimus]
MAAESLTSTPTVHHFKVARRALLINGSYRVPDIDNTRSIMIIESHILGSSSPSASLESARTSSHPDSTDSSSIMRSSHRMGQMQPLCSNRASSRVSSRGFEQILSNQHTKLSCSVCTINKTSAPTRISARAYKHMVNPSEYTQVIFQLSWKFEVSARCVVFGAHEGVRGARTCPFQAISRPDIDRFVYTIPSTLQMARKHRKQSTVDIILTWTTCTLDAEFEKIMRSFPVVPFSDKMVQTFIKHCRKT